MDTDDLRALLDVVRFGSFQAAAAALRVPRTRLRRHIERLEETLGTKLLHRDARGIRLTAAGVRVVEHGAPVLAAADAALAAARSADPGPATLRFVQPVGLPTDLRARALGMLEQLAPELSLVLQERDDPLAALTEPFDLLMYFGEAVERNGLFGRVLFRVRVGLFAAPAYLERAGTPTSASALGGHRLLVWSRALARDGGLPVPGGAGLPAHPVLHAANERLVREAVVQGLGIGLMASPEDPVLGGGRDALVPVLPDAVGGEVQVRLLTRRRTRDDEPTAALLANVDRLLEALAPS